MKKILALVLALVMTLSLATISSGAAFSDADSVQYTDAVNTLTALGVLNGYADGSIKPQGDVTRGAAAKMVAMVATGSNATTLGYYKGTSSFADVPATHVFADAVAFCVARGIVAGYGDGNYGLTDNVKGWAVAKMVLVAMGYDAKAYGMEGTGSALNTITLASSLGLFAGMKADFVATEAASREECAQIVYNALTLQGKVANPTSSDGVLSFSDSGKALLENYGYGIGGGTQQNPEPAFGTAALTVMAGNIGMVTDNQATGATYTKIGGVDYAVETGKELIGHVVLAVANGAKDAYGKDCVYAVVDLSSEVTVATAIAKKADYEAAFGTTALAIDAAGNNANVDDLVVFYNYNDGAQLPQNFAFAAGTTKNTSAGTYVIYNGTVVSYMTAASDLVVLTVKVDDATKGYYTVFADADSDTVVDNNETVYVKVAEDANNCVDYITSAAAIDWMAMDTDKDGSAVAVYVGTPCGSKLAVEDVKVVEGKASLINTSTSKITVNGTVYDYVTNAATEAAAMGVTAMAATFADLTNTYKFYLDEAGKIFAYTLASTTSDTNSYELAYVVGSKEVPTGMDATYGTTSYAYSIQYYTVDGSVNTAAYYSWNGSKVVNSAALNGEVSYAAVANNNATEPAEVAGWVLVAKTANGVAVKAIDAASGYTATTANGTMTATSTKLGNNFVTKASAFLYSGANAMVATNTAATVKSGAHVATIAANTPVVLKASANANAYDVVAVWVGADYQGDNVAADFVYVANYEGYVGLDAATQAELYSDTVIDKNGVESVVTYTVDTTGNNPAADTYAGKFYELSTNSASGLTTFGNQKQDVANVAGYSTYVVDGVKYLESGNTKYVVASGVKMYDLRANALTGAAEAVDTVDEMLALTANSYVAYVLTTANSDNTVVTINTIIVVDAPVQQQ